MSEVTRIANIRPKGSKVRVEEIEKVDCKNSILYHQEWFYIFILISTKLFSR